MPDVTPAPGGRAQASKGDGAPVDATLLRASPWVGALIPGRYGPQSASAAAVGLVAEPLLELAICNIMPRRGMEEALSERLGTGFGLPLPGIGKALFNERLGIAWDGHRRWRAWAPIGQGWGHGKDLVQALREALDGLGAVVDQSHGHAAIRIEGPRVRALLAKGTSLDLHPERFRAGDCAPITIAGTAIHLTALTDDPALAVQLQLFRSHVEAFAHWLVRAGGEFGLEVREV